MEKTAIFCLFCIAVCSEKSVGIIILLIKLPNTILPKREKTSLHLLKNMSEGISILVEVKMNTKDYRSNLLKYFCQNYL